MATYIEIWNLWSSSNLRTRTAVACMQAATDVLNESPATQDHANRVLWALSALHNPEATAIRMIWSVVSNPTIQTAGDAALDADIQFVVNSAVSVFAIGEAV